MSTIFPTPPNAPPPVWPPQIPAAQSIFKTPEDFGAVAGDVGDQSAPLQAWLDYCIAHRLEARIHGGRKYRHSKTLKAGTGSAICSLQLRGGAAGYPAHSNASVLHYTGKDGVGLALQGLWHSELANFSVRAGRGDAGQPQPRDQDRRLAIRSSGSERTHACGEQDGRERGPEQASDRERHAIYLVLAPQLGYSANVQERPRTPGQAARETYEINQHAPEDMRWELAAAAANARAAELRASARQDAESLE